MITILRKYGMTGSTVIIKDLLHLKTGISYLGDNIVLVSAELRDRGEDVFQITTN